LQVTIIIGVCWHQSLLPIASGDQLPSSSEQASTSSRGNIGDLGFKAFVSEAEWRKIDEKVSRGHDTWQPPQHSN
jgi:hypothetical protein